MRGAPGHLLCFEEMTFGENAYRFLGSGQWPGCLDRKCTERSDTKKSDVEAYGSIRVSMSVIIFMSHVVPIRKHSP